MKITVRAYNWISVCLAFILFCFEVFILWLISGTTQYLILHTITILILGAYIYLFYGTKYDLLYPLLLFILALGAGPFGLGTFILIALFRPIFALFASSAAVWFEGLYPEQQLTLFEKIIHRIRSRWDDYSQPSETSSFQNLFTYGQLSDKQKVLDAIIENFDPSYSPILKEALDDRYNVVRIQAAAIITKIDMDYDIKLKKLERLHEEFPQNADILLQLAEHADGYFFVGILDEMRQKEIASLAVKHYQNYLHLNPDNINVWLAISRLLFYQKDYQSFIDWYEKGKQKFNVLPSILHSWYLESFYKLADEVSVQMRKE